MRAIIWWCIGRPQKTPLGMTPVHGHLVGRLSYGKVSNFTHATKPPCSFALAPVLPRSFLVAHSISRLMSRHRDHGDFLGHATDWMASAAECANARRRALPAPMDSAAGHIVVGDSRAWHDR